MHVSSVTSPLRAVALENHITSALWPRGVERGGEREKNINENAMASRTHFRTYIVRL